MKCPNCDFEPMYETAATDILGNKTGVVIYICPQCRVTERREDG
jgi:hypothetical protein